MPIPPTEPSPDHPGTDETRVDRTRWVVFAVVCLIAIGVALGAIIAARRDRDNAFQRADSVAIDDGGAASALGDAVPDLMFESTALGSNYGRIATVPRDDPGAPRAFGDLSCERVHARGGRGVCLFADRGFVTTFDAIVFDEGLRELHRIGLAGSPSRVRVSPSGDIAGITVFVTGHSYAQTGFSTQTTLVDLERGEVLADLEVDFTVRRAGEIWRDVDFNLWGVTFVDDDRFYATLASGGSHHLVEGEVSSGELAVLADGVECPSLSPDGTRLAFKSRQDDGLGPVTWRIAVLDVATMERWELAETRSVDDQVTWLDADTVMYGLPDASTPAETDTWVVPADGSGAPELLLDGAWSAFPVEAVGSDPTP